MDAYQSLCNRVASLEDLLRRSESTASIMLQRIKALEEHAVASEGRYRSESAARNDGLALRLDKVADACNAKLELFNGNVQRQDSAMRLLEERMKNLVSVLEQKVSNSISDCHQRMQVVESSLTSALRSMEGNTRSQLDGLRSVNSAVQNEVAALQQGFSGEQAYTRQRVERLESSFHGALEEVKRMFSGDIANLANGFKTQLQSTEGSLSAAVTALDQKVQAGLNAVQSTLSREISADRQAISSVDTNLREGMQSLHGTLSSDITTLSSQLQVEGAAMRTMHQQLLAELSSHRQQIEKMDANWRAAVTDLDDRIQEVYRSLRDTQTTDEITFQKSIAQVNSRIDDVASELRRAADNIEQMVQSRLAILDSMRNDVIRTKQALASEQDERRRLQEEMQKFSTLAERSVLQLHSVMDAAVRATHNDLLERLRPLTTFRSEIHTAVTTALNKLWTEVQRTFASQREFQTIQDQIEVLDNAVRQEVTLLAEKGRLLERHAINLTRPATPPAAAAHGERASLPTSSEAVVLRSQNSTLVPFDTAGELNTVWDELRGIQNKLNASREEVVTLIGDTRKELLNNTLDIVKESGDEFRTILSKIKSDIYGIMPQVEKTLEAARSRYSTDSRQGGSASSKRTVIRLLRRSAGSASEGSEGVTSTGTGELPPLATVSTREGDTTTAPPSHRTKPVEENRTYAEASTGLVKDKTTSPASPLPLEQIYIGLSSTSAAEQSNNNRNRYTPDTPPSREKSLHQHRPALCPYTIELATEVPGNEKVSDRLGSSDKSEKHKCPTTSSRTRSSDEKESKGMSRSSAGRSKSFSEKSSSYHCAADIHDVNNSSRAPTAEEMGDARSMSYTRSSGRPPVEEAGTTEQSRAPSVGDGKYSSGSAAGKSDGDEERRSVTSSDTNSVSETKSSDGQLPSREVGNREEPYMVSSASRQTSNSAGASGKYASSSSHRESGSRAPTAEEMGGTRSMSYTRSSGRPPVEEAGTTEQSRAPSVGDGKYSSGSAAGKSDGDEERRSVTSSDTNSVSETKSSDGQLPSREVGNREEPYMVSSASRQTSNSAGASGKYASSSSHRESGSRAPTAEEMGGTRSMSYTKASVDAALKQLYLGGEGVSGFVRDGSNCEGSNNAAAEMLLSSVGGAQLVVNESPIYSELVESKSDSHHTTRSNALVVGVDSPTPGNLYVNNSAVDSGPASLPDVSVNRRNSDGAWLSRGPSNSDAVISGNSTNQSNIGKNSSSVSKRSASGAGVAGDDVSTAVSSNSSVGCGKSGGAVKSKSSVSSSSSYSGSDSKAIPNSASSTTTFPRLEELGSAGLNSAISSSSASATAPSRVTSVVPLPPIL
uniref:Uncharacterized protein n=1 Tax=Trypanosoma congolense (strain IL3000) TaxID=1068625 RepID=G0UZ40_TRYCI|nr:conserved hypothetical protein [Trypanosoma congolense IL3000]